MPRRPSVVQVSFRLRQDTLGKLKRAAKQHDRSMNDEIMRRLEDSLVFDDWREKRGRILEEMRRKLERHLKEARPQKSPQANPAEKPHNSRSVQVRFRLRQDIVAKLENEAMERGRSTHDEIGIRLEESIDCPNPWEQLMPLISALIDDAASLRNPKTTIAAYTEMDWEAERDFQEQTMAELFPPRRIHVRLPRAKA
jgi:Arc-like DNA binding domain